MEFDRHNSFSMRIEDNSSAEVGSIRYLTALQGSLYAFTDNSIYTVLPAESIDPENLHPETRHSYQKCYSVGCKNSYVDRSIIQTKEILDFAILNKNIDKKNILDNAWSCAQLLLNCESIHFGIYDEVIRLMPECDTIIENGKRGILISALPQVEDLNGKVAVYLGNAKRFLERTHNFLSIFFDAPNAEANFQAYLDWIVKNKPDNQRIIHTLEDDKEWIRRLALLRNAHEINHAEPQNDVQIANFRLCPGNKVAPPSWKFDLRAKKGPVQSEYSDIVIDMNIFLSNLLTFFEDLVMCCIEDSFDKTWKSRICEKSGRRY